MTPTPQAQCRPRKARRLATRASNSHHRAAQASDGDSIQERIAARLALFSLV
jgi:hypothetical protein